jgi:hypothetical protein
MYLTSKYLFFFLMVAGWPCYLAEAPLALRHHLSVILPLNFHYNYKEKQIKVKAFSSINKKRALFAPYFAMTLRISTLMSSTNLSTVIS